jgi:AcrR family transcriptional regulator
VPTTPLTTELLVAPASTGRRGRPAGPAASTRVEVLTAALDLLVTEGVASLTVVRLHERSGVARSTIYRHWPTPDDVVDDLLEVAARTEQPAPTGDLATDLGGALDALVRRMRERPVAQFLGALLSGAQDDAANAARRARYVDALLAGVTAAVRAARPPVAPAAREDVVALAAGPLLVHWLATGRPPTRAKARTGVEAALARAYSRD